MSAEVEKVRLDFFVSASLQVGDKEEFTWIKPGVSTGITWKGMPTPEQISAAKAYFHGEVLAPAMDEIVDMVAARLKDHETSVDQLRS